MSGTTETTDLVTPEYLPFDQEHHLGDPPWSPDAVLVQAWEAAHGHDVRLKCYVEFGCQAIENEAEWLRARLVAARAALQQIAAKYAPDADPPRNEHGTPVGDDGEAFSVYDFSHGEDFASYMADVARTELAKVARDALAALDGSALSPDTGLARRLRCSCSHQWLDHGKQTAASLWGCTGCSCSAYDGPTPDGSAS